MIYLDCFQGAAGDMLVGALLDIESDHSWYARRISELPVLNAAVEIEKKSISGISGTRPMFQSACSEKFNTRSSVFAVLEKLGLEDDLREQTGSVYKAVFEAESEVHGTDAEDLHLHELAGPETLLEIISFFLLLRGRRVYCSTLTLGSGSIITAHGEIPLPAPVTAGLLKGLPVRISDRVHDKELVTPTAAALIRSACSFGPPDMRITNTGYGLGGRSVLRIIEFDQQASDIQTSYQIEANIDDMTSEDISALAEDLLSVASDVYIVPAVMKKGRPGHLLTVLVTDDLFARVKEMILCKSSTAGFRYWETGKIILPRNIVEFRSSYGKCRIKIQTVSGSSIKVKPEFDDLKILAEKTGERVSFLRDKITREYLDE